jgi:chlorite dismutase
VNDWPYHQYLFFKLDRGFSALSPAERPKLGALTLKWATTLTDVRLESYSTLGFKPETTLMLWLRARTPESLQSTIRDLLRTPIGEWLTLSASLFGLVRPSPYSGRHQSGPQVISEHERLPYLIIYPFTKTHSWHQLPFEERRTIMADHVSVGLSHRDVRQLLLYGYGVEDHEFVVSYETPTLEKFQDLVIALRSTRARLYTANDQPTYLCLHKPLEELLEWL